MKNNKKAKSGVSWPFLLILKDFKDLITQYLS